MITTGSKWFYGFGVAALALALAYGWSTGGDGLGPLTAGYKGGVGDHFGYGILLAAATLAIFLGAVSTAVRDADPRAVAEVAGTDAPPAAKPAGASYWPIVGAFGAGLVAVGIVVEPLLVIAGFVALTIVLIEWAVQAWSDRATGDPAANREIRNRLMYPVEIPIGGTLLIAVVVISISRVLLAVSAASAVWVATAVAAVVVLVAAVVSARPSVRSDVLAALLAVAAVGVITAGVIGAAVGERDFEKHASEGEHEPGPGAETGEPSAGEPEASTTTAEPLTSTTEAGG